MSDAAAPSGLRLALWLPLALFLAVVLLAVWGLVHPKDDTVPSRLYFHCGGVILAVIDRGREGAEPFQPTPDNLYRDRRARRGARAGNRRARREWRCREPARG